MPPLGANEEAADAVRELGNIAFSHAATALATLLDRRVDVGIPAVHVLGREEVEEDLGARAGDFYVVSFRLVGDHAGILAVLFPQADAGALLDILHRRRAPSASLDAEGESALLEIGNIMAGSALLAIYRMLGATLLHSTPSLHRRTPLQLADEGLFPGPVMLVLEAEFTVEGRHACGTMVISPSDPLPLVSRLGIEMEAG
jgi:chemotaxis protein CheC